MEEGVSDLGANHRPMRMTYPMEFSAPVTMELGEMLAVKDAISLLLLVRDGHLEQAAEMTSANGDYDYVGSAVIPDLGTLEEKLDEALKPHRLRVKEWMAARDL